MKEAAKPLLLLECCRNKADNRQEGLLAGCNSCLPSVDSVYRPHVKLHGDVTKATGKEFEIGSLTPDVRIEEHLCPTLRHYLFKANEPPHGQVYLLLRDRLYKQPFAFPETAQGGNAAANWLEVRIPELLQHPVD